MTGVGPLRDAPNPLQRQFARSALVFAVFFGLMLGGAVAVLMSISALGGGNSWTRVAVVSGLVGLGSGALFHAFNPGRKMSAEERGDLWVVYMPWFGNDSESQAERERVERRARPRQGTVALRDARNPIQRLAVSHPLLAYLIGYLLAATVLLVAMRAWSLSVVTVVVALAVVLACGLYWRSDLRQMTADERAQSHVLHLWPGRKTTN